MLSKKKPTNEETKTKIKTFYLKKIQKYSFTYGRFKM